MIRLAFVLLSACAVETPTHSVTWSATGMSDSRGEPDPIMCTSLISHPCPIMLYMRRLDVTAATTPGSVNLRWWGGTGGADFNGRTAEDELPIVEVALEADGALALTDRGDDGGLRHMATLAPAADGWEGDLAWSLFNVAGHTTFHVTIGGAP